MDTLSQLLDDIHLTGAEFCYVHAAAPWGFDFHAEGVASFHLVLSGNAVLYQAGEAPLPLQAGDMAIVTSGRDHRVLDEARSVADPLPNLTRLIQGHDHEPLVIGGTGALTHLMSARFRFDADLAKPLLAALPPVLLIQGINDSPPAWLRIGLEFLAQEVLARAGRQAIINRVAGILFIECVRDYVEALPAGANTWLRALRDPALSPVLSAMHSKPDYPWSVAELAALACLSRSAFADRFGGVMGQPPLSYLAEHRMRLAVWQLQHTRQPICRIAEMVGYSSETAFSQAFKRVYGTAPSRFRQNAG